MSRTAIEPKRFQHPIIGEVTLAYEELAITAEPGLACSSTPPNLALPLPNG